MIEYHSGKANVVVDALCQKLSGSLYHINVTQIKITLVSKTKYRVSMVSNTGNLRILY